MIDPGKLKSASQSWQTICRKWGIRTIVPFVLKVEGQCVDCIAYLPDFGGPNGMVIGAMDLPEVSSDDRVFALARKKGLFCSFVNVSAFGDRKIAENVFKDALEDWGYFGPPENRPLLFENHKGDKTAK